MSNIMPQSAANNQGVWDVFEGYCRSMLTTNELLIICGPSGFGTNTIPSGKAYIASNVWKVVVCVPLGGGTALSRITATNRVIAISVPNVTNGLSSAWTNYLTSPQKIEQATGFTFFTALPANVAAALRAKVDGVPAPPTLSAALSGAKFIVSWPSPATGYSLQQNTNLCTTNWTAFGGIVCSNSTTMSATNSAPAGNMFYRLFHP